MYITEWTTKHFHGIVSVNNKTCHRLVSIVRILRVHQRFRLLKWSMNIPNIPTQLANTAYTIWQAVSVVTPGQRTSEVSGKSYRALYLPSDHTWHMSRNKCSSPPATAVSLLVITTRDVLMHIYHPIIIITVNCLQYFCLFV